MVGCTGAQAVPEAANLRGSGGRGGRGKEGRERPSQGPLGSGAAPGPRVELSQSAGKSWARPTCEGRRERRRTLSCGVRVVDTARPILGTLSCGSLDAPDSPDPIPNFRPPGPCRSEPGFGPALQIPGTGPLTDSGFPDSVQRFPILRSLDPCHWLLPRPGCPEPGA